MPCWQKLVIREPVRVDGIHALARRRFRLSAGRHEPSALMLSRIPRLCARLASLLARAESLKAAKCEAGRYCLTFGQVKAQRVSNSHVGQSFSGQGLGIEGVTLHSYLYGNPRFAGRALREWIVPNFLQRVAAPIDQPKAHFEDCPLAFRDTGQNSVELLFEHAVAVHVSPIVKYTLPQLSLRAVGAAVGNPDKPRTPKAIGGLLLGEYIARGYFLHFEKRTADVLQREDSDIRGLKVLHHGPTLASDRDKEGLHSRVS